MSGEALVCAFIPLTLFPTPVISNFRIRERVPKVLLKAWVRPLSGQKIQGSAWQGAGNRPRQEGNLQKWVVGRPPDWLLPICLGLAMWVIFAHVVLAK